MVEHLLPFGEDLIRLALEVEEMKSIGNRGNGAVELLGGLYGYHNAQNFTRAVKKAIRRSGKIYPSYHQLYNDPPVVNQDCLVLFDPHIPFQDADFVNKCIDLAVAWKLPCLVIGGDALDVTAISRFVKNPEETWEHEMDAWRAFQVVVREKFQRVLAITGNHEFRLAKILMGLVTPKRSLALLDIFNGIEFSDYSYCKHTAGWIIGHPEEYSRIPGQVPAEIADIYQSHVVLGHNHYWGMRKSKSGQFFAVDAGHCCLPEALRYKATSISRRPIWNEGALVLKKSDDKWYHYLLYPEMDWQAMRRMY